MFDALICFCIYSHREGADKPKNHSDSPLRQIIYLKKSKMPNQMGGAYLVDETPEFTIFGSGVLKILP
jgi:hypothetical protein